MKKAKFSSEFFSDGNKISDKIREVCERLGIEEGLVTIVKLNGNQLLVTELRIIMLDKNMYMMWQHDFHRDVIVEVKTTGVEAYVREFDGGKYVLDLLTGKVLR